MFGANEKQFYAYIYFYSRDGKWRLVLEKTRANSLRGGT
jgi:hypothetical protein